MCVCRDATVDVAVLLVGLLLGGGEDGGAAVSSLRSGRSKDAWPSCRHTLATSWQISTCGETA